MNLHKHMSIYKAKINIDLLNLALPSIKQLKIKNKNTIKYIQMQIYIQTQLIVPCMWGQYTIT